MCYRGEQLEISGNLLRELPERQFVKLFRVSKELLNFIVTLYASEKKTQ
jgi:hypothetical protein